MSIREYQPGPFFRASIDSMDDLEDCKTYVAEYFCFKIPRHGEAVFTDLADAEEFLFRVYAETTPDVLPAELRSEWFRANQAAYAGITRNLRDA